MVGFAEEDEPTLEKCSFLCHEREALPVCENIGFGNVFTVTKDATFVEVIKSISTL